MLFVCLSNLWRYCYMKKVVSILLTIVLSLGLLGSVAFAVNPAYAFNL